MLQNIDPPKYCANPAESDENAVVARALEILARRIATGPVFDSPQSVRDYLRLRVGGLQHEVFGVVFLDSQHRVISCEVMFTGTLAQTAVYPREVVKAALRLNAGAAVLFHNHPSGTVTPSRADECLTRTIKTALSMVDTRVLDHVIVSPTGSSSFVELGLL